MSVLKRRVGNAIAMNPPTVVDARKPHMVATIVRTLKDLRALKA